MPIIFTVLALGAAQEPPIAERDRVVVVGRRADGADVGPDIAAAGASSLDATALADLAIAGLADVATAIPNLAARPTGAMAVEQYAIRGLHAPVGAPTVALYLDDVPLSVRPSAFLGAPDVAALDLEGVEVLRGAQGTASGAAALAGIVRLKARRPDFDRAEASASAEVRATEDGAPGFRTAVAAGMPVAGGVAVRAAASVERAGGYVDRVGTDPQGDVDAVVTRAARVTLGVRAGDWLVLPSVTVQHRRSDDLSIAQGFGSLAQAFVRRQPGRDALLAAGVRAEGAVGAVAVVGSAALLDRDVRQAVDYSPAFGELVLGGAVPGLLVPGGSLSTIRSHQRGWTAEVRASGGSDAAGWVAGVQASRTDLRIAQAVTEPGIAALTRRYLGDTVTGVFGTPLVDGTDSYRSAERDRETALAGFATASWSPLARLRATAGMRAATWRVAIRSHDAGPYAGAAIAEPQGGTRTATRLLPRASLSWRPSGEQEAAVSWSRGYRPGGGNVPVSAGLCADDLAALGRSDAPLGYRGDDADTLDLAWRAATPRGAVAVTGFASRWRDVAQQVELPGCGFAYVDNVGRARVHGGEAEGVLRPARGLTLDAALGYVDARFVPTRAAPRGSRLPYVPRWTTRLAGRWEGAVAHGTLLAVGLSHRYAGAFRRPANRADIARGPAVGRLDAWARLARGALSLGLFVRNLANARPDLYASVDLVPATGFPVRTATIRPRTWGLNLAWQVRP